MRGIRWLTTVVTLSSAAALMLLHACQDQVRPTEPELAVVTRKTLTVTGTGTGSGVVTSVPAGINCTITAGVAAQTGCIALYDKGTVVTLTATPKSGHSFLTWAGYCTGTGTCRAPMTANRAVRARFLVGPFTIKVASGTLGAGSGTVRSQPGLVPAINCVITNGTPGATGCSAKYPAYTALTLTATPATSFVLHRLGRPLRRRWALPVQRAPGTDHPRHLHPGRVVHRRHRGTLGAAVHRSGRRHPHERAADRQGAPVGPQGRRPALGRDRAASRP